MKLSINNFRRIEKADITIDGVALVCGHNANGKTSIAQALGACLTKDTQVIQSLTKKEAKNLVKDGSKAAIVTLSSSALSVSVQYPTGEITEQGDTINAGRIACGIDHFSRLDKKDAAKLIYKVLRINPTQVEFSALIKQSVAAAGFDITDDVVVAIWESLKITGWEKTQADVQAQARDFKRDWQNITGENWGAEKAKTWQPEGFDLTATEVTADLIDKLKTAFEQAIAHKAVSGEEKRILTELAENYTALKDQYKLDRVAVEGAKVALQVIDGQLSDITKEIANSTTICCPSCQVGLHFDGDKLIKSDIQASDEQIAALKSDLIKFTDGRKLQSDSLKQMEEELAETLRKGTAAGDADRALKQIKEGGSDAEQLELSRKALDEAYALQKNQQNIIKAGEINDKITAYLHVADELSETGMRKRRLDTVLNDFNNGLLAEYSKKMGVNPVTLDMDMRLWLAKRLYLESSAAELFIMDIVMQFAIATLENAAMVIIDGADIIQFTKGRESLIMAARHFGKPVLITMSIATPELCPILSKNGLGHTYWLQDGVAKELV